MDIVVVVVLVVVVLAALGAGGAVLARRRRSQQLQEEFGPEYDRVLERSESRSEAESTLQERRKRHRELDLRPLDPRTREEFRDRWSRVQQEFVDDPGGAVENADSLVTTIMRERGYPVDDFDQRAADVSVEHPRVVESYRQARRVRDGHREGTAGTEDLRSAVTAYRELVDALLDESDDDRDAGDDDRREGSGGGARHRDNGHRPATAGSTDEDEHSDGSRR